MNAVPGGHQADESVAADWLQPLPEERQHLFNRRTLDWEHGYAMFSLTLDGALTARARGELVQARQQVACASELAERLLGSLLPTLSALEDVRQWWRTPAVEPLQPGLFRRESAQEAATWNSILHWPLVFRRWQYALKLRSLRQAVRIVTREFCELAEEISQGICVDPAAAWRALEALHDDLNTVLREAFVVLKSFLCAVSGEGYRLFLVATDEAKVKAFRTEGDISPASP